MTVAAPVAAAASSAAALHAFQLSDTEADLVNLFRLFDAFSQRGQSAPSSDPAAGQQAATAAVLAALTAQLNTLTQEVKALSTTTSSLSDKEAQLATEISGLRDDLNSATARIAASDAAQAQVVSDLNTELSRLKSLPTDTTAFEAVLTSAIDGIQQSRAVAQNIDLPAAGAGGTTTVSGGAGTDTTTGGAAGTTTAADPNAPTGQQQTI